MLTTMQLPLLHIRCWLNQPACIRLFVLKVMKLIFSRVKSKKLKQSL